MFENYLAAKRDFMAIEEALRYVWHPKLDFVFRNKTPIKTAVIVSFDSQFIYLWSQMKLSKLTQLPCQLKNYFAYKVPHQLLITKELQRVWHAGLPPEIENLLPKSIKDASVFAIPRIGGGLLTPFITLQKSVKQKYNPYTTRQSYLATIVHEFGHVYWNFHKLWWLSDKVKNIHSLDVAKKLYESQRTINSIHLNIPSPYWLGEVFATCVEYCAAELFWSSHRKNFDRFATNRLERLIGQETTGNLNSQDSILEPTKYPHHFAMVFGKILLSRYPKTWHRILLAKPKIP